MTHIDAEDLAVGALEPHTVTALQQDHLGDCSECAAELHALERTVQAGRAAPAVHLEQPSAAVWVRLHQELGLSASVARLPVETPLSASTPAAEPGSPATPTAASAAEEQPAAARPVVTLRRTRRLWLPLAAATVVGIIAGIGASTLWQAQSTVETVTARAQLDPLPGWTDTGTATIAVDSDGRRQVLVEVESPTGAASDDDVLREVWLLTQDASGLVSLGLLDGSSGRFAVPAGIDLGQYPLVDVSVEPDDGNPGHSGDSVVRGDLRRA